MPLVNQDLIILKARGIFDATISYRANDWMAHNGIPYLASMTIAAGNPPDDVDNPTNGWARLGDSVIEGPRGLIGIQGNGVIPVYQRGATQPTTPTATWDGVNLTVSTGWTITIPSGTDILYRSDLTLDNVALTASATGVGRWTGPVGPEPSDTRLNTLISDALTAAIIAGDIQSAAEVLQQIVDYLANNDYLTESVIQDLINNTLTSVIATDGLIDVEYSTDQIDWQPDLAAYRYVRLRGSNPNAPWRVLDLGIVVSQGGGGGLMLGVAIEYSIDEVTWHDPPRHTDDNWFRITVGLGGTPSGGLPLAGSGGAGATNLDVENVTGTTLDITSSSGTDATVPAATDTDAGLQSAADKTKLDDLAADQQLPDGGTTGQVLKKDSTTDYDVSWQDDTSGAAGTDLSIANRTGVSLDIASNTGADATLPSADATDAGLMAAAHYTKLDGIEPNATADLTAGEIKSLYESNADTNAFTDAEMAKLAGIDAGAEVNVPTNLSIGTHVGASLEIDSSTGTNVTLPGATTSEAGMLTAQDKAKLDGLDDGRLMPSGGTMGQVLKKDSAVDYDASWMDDTTGAGGTNLSLANQTGTTLDILSNTGTDVTLPSATTTEAGLHSAADKAKSDGVEAGATADQTDAEIKTAYENNPDTNAFTDAEKAKLTGIDAGAQVNVGTDLSIGTHVGTSVEIDSSTGTNVIIPGATPSEAGVLSSTDKAKIDGLAINRQIPDGGATGQVLKKDSPTNYDASWQDDEQGMGGTGSTNLSVANRDANSLDIASDTGTDATVPSATPSDAGLQSAADKTKLNTLATDRQMPAGGAVGQVLKKDTATDYDASWQDDEQGMGGIGTTNLSVANRTGTSLDIASSTGTDATVPSATPSEAGLQSAADKAKLDGVATGAEVNVSTNLSIANRDGNTLDVASSTGADATLPSATNTGAGLMTAAQHVKLGDVEANATADQTATEIKTAYESNADTNAFTDAEQTKLGNLATNRQIPSGGSSGQVLKKDTNANYDVSWQADEMGTGGGGTPLTEEQAIDATSTVFGTVSGQELFHSVRRHVPDVVPPRFTTVHRVVSTADANIADDAISWDFVGGTTYDIYIKAHVDLISTFFDELPIGRTIVLLDDTLDNSWTGTLLSKTQDATDTELYILRLDITNQSGSFMLNDDMRVEFEYVHADILDNSITDAHIVGTLTDLEKENFRTKINASDAATSNTLRSQVISGYTNQTVRLTYPLSGQSWDSEPVDFFTSVPAAWAFADNTLTVAGTASNLVFADRTINFYIQSNHTDAVSVHNVRFEGHKNNGNWQRIHRNTLTTYEISPNERQQVTVSGGRTFSNLVDMDEFVFRFRFDFIDSANNQHRSAFVIDVEGAQIEATTTGNVGQTVEFRVDSNGNFVAVDADDVEHPAIAPDGGAASGGTLDDQIKASDKRYTQIIIRYAGLPPTPSGGTYNTTTGVFSPPVAPNGTAWQDTATNPVIPEGDLTLYTADVEFSSDGSIRYYSPLPHGHENRAILKHWEAFQENLVDSLVIEDDVLYLTIAYDNGNVNEPPSESDKYEPLGVLLLKSREVSLSGIPYTVTLPQLSWDDTIGNAWVWTVTGNDPEIDQSYTLEDNGRTIVGAHKQLVVHLPTLVVDPNNTLRRFNNNSAALDVLAGDITIGIVAYRASDDTTFSRSIAYSSTGEQIPWGWRVQRFPVSRCKQYLHAQRRR